MRKRAGALSLGIPASRGIVHRVVHRFAHNFVACPTFLTRLPRRIGYCRFVLRESKDKLSMVPRQGQTCRGYPFLGPGKVVRQAPRGAFFIAPLTRASVPGSRTLHRVRWDASPRCEPPEEPPAIHQQKWFTRRHEEEVKARRSGPDPSCLPFLLRAFVWKFFLLMNCRVANGFSQ